MTSYKHVLTQIFYMSNLSHSFLVWLMNPYFTAIDNMANATRSSVGKSMMRSVVPSVIS